MRIHSDKLTTDDLYLCTPCGVHAEVMTIGRPRKRLRGWNVGLWSEHGTRSRNSGQYGAGTDKAASWDEWGLWMNALYAIDPDALIGPYKSLPHFREVTAQWQPRGMSAPWLQGV
jgi:hypothetical protein